MMRNKVIRLYSILIALGIILMLIGSFIFTKETQNTLSGLSLGIGAGIFGLSIGQIIITIISLKNPEFKRRNEIEENDERNIIIRHHSKAKGFDAMGFIFGILMLMYVFIDADLTIILLLVAAYLLVYTIQIYYLYKYSKEM